MGPENTEHGKKATEKEQQENPSHPEESGNPPGSLVKERQPSMAGDLSSIHDTHEVGTAGGDQRSNDLDPSRGAKKAAPVITNLGAETVESGPTDHSKHKNNDESGEVGTPPTGEKTKDN
jgi:hypothetical protein